MQEKRFYPETEEISYPSALPYHGTPSSCCEREKRGGMFLSPARLSFPSCLVHPPQKLAMIHSLQTQVSDAQLPDLLSSRYTLLSFLHQLCTRLTKAQRSPFLAAPASKDEAGNHPLYRRFNYPLAGPGWHYAVINPGTVPLCSWGHK